MRGSILHASESRRDTMSDVAVEETKKVRIQIYIASEETAKWKNVVKTYNKGVIKIKRYNKVMSSLKEQYVIF
jgi:hypothetical protein